MTDIAVTQTADGLAVVTARGDLDAAVADQLKRTFTDLLTNGATRFVVDLSETRYLDSAALGVLVATVGRARQAGGDVRLCGLQPDVQSILAMTRLTKVLKTYPSRDAALVNWP